MIEVTIDGVPIKTSPRKTVMEVALDNGIDIPRLCYHPELSVSGGCRLCQVEVEGWDGPTVSCGLVCQDGMNIQTRSQELDEIRREIIDLFVAEHPLDCVTCDKSGACLLQKYAYDYGVTETSHEFQLSRELYQDDNPFFIRDHKYCILCGKCVRVCDEIVGAGALEYAGRGFESYIATPFDDPLADTSCVFCGSCVQVCPTAALMPVSRKGKGREWELERVRTVCSYCGVGCEVEYAKKGEDILYAQSRPEAPVNGEFLCTKGRYGWDFAKNKDRLTSPMVRKDIAYELGLTNEAWTLPEESPLSVKDPNIKESFVPVGWDTALDLVAGKLAQTVKTHGSDSIMGLASARCTNEENYLFQKFFRASIKTNNIDHCARL
jgi:formate dehydrogenase alpha subunit